MTTPARPEVPGSEDVFGNELRSLLNRHSAEKGSDTPDYLLADFLRLCLSAFDGIVRDRDRWHGYAPFQACGACGGGAKSSAHPCACASLASGDAITEAEKAARVAMSRKYRPDLFTANEWEELAHAAIRATAPIFRAEAETRVGKLQRKLDRAHCVVVDLTAERDRMRAALEQIREEMRDAHDGAHIPGVRNILLLTLGVTPPPGGATYKDPKPPEWPSVVCPNCYRIDGRHSPNCPVGGATR